MAQPGAVVDIVGADHYPHQFLQQVVLFIRRSRRGDGGYRVRAVVGDSAPQLLSDKIQRVLPAGRLQPAVSPDQRTCQPVAGAGERMGEPALHAGVTPVNRSIERRRHRGHRVVAYVHIEGAADAAVAAGGPGDHLDRVRIVQTELEEGTSGARVDTAAAGDARRVDPLVTGTSHQNGVGAATSQGQRCMKSASARGVDCISLGATLSFRSIDQRCWLLNPHHDQLGIRLGRGKYVLRSGIDPPRPKVVIGVPKASLMALAMA